jgi:pyrimidine operon attenuation protein / uracil phosphoribosyltransferase
MAADRYRLYTTSDLDAVIASMARRALGLLDGTPTTLVGMLRRGVPIADRLQAAMRALAPAIDVERLDLHVKRYADNLELLHPQTQLEMPAAARLGGRRVIVVDDVLYRGHSLFRVFEWLRAQSVASTHAAVLVDRCSQCMPVYADIVGVALQIAPDDVIECNVPPYENEFAIDLWRPAASG